MLVAKQKALAGGHELITGAVSSNTVMVCVLEAAFPLASVTVYVRETIKRLTQVVFEITSTCDIIIGLQLSTAVIAASFAAGTIDAQLTVTFGGITILVGAVTS